LKFRQLKAKASRASRPQGEVARDTWAVTTMDQILTVTSL